MVNSRHHLIVAVGVLLSGCAMVRQSGEPAIRYAATTAELCNAIDPSMPGCLAPVPMRIPLEWNEPARYLNSRVRVPCNAGESPMCVGDVVTVHFHRHATQAERQAAVDAVGGVLEGGSWATNAYYVRVPADSSRPPAWTAMVRLRSLPQVSRATVYALHLMHPDG